MATKKKAPRPAADGNNDAREKDRESAWAKVQKLIDHANDAVVAWQQKFATVGQRIAAPPVVPKTPAHTRAQAKRQRHADAVQAGEMNYKDIAHERQAEFAERFATFPAMDRTWLTEWAAQQEALHGSPLGVWEHHAMPWPLVFLAARYGAEVEHWPTALSNDDRSRLAALQQHGGPRLPLVEPLHVAATNKQQKRRVHLFAAPEHAPHVASAMQRAATTVTKE